MKASLTPVAGRGDDRQWSTHRVRAQIETVLPNVSSVAMPFRASRLLCRASVVFCIPPRLDFGVSVVSCFSFFASAEDSIWDQCAEQGSRLLILSWLGAGWSHIVIVLSNLDSDQRKALRTKCLMKPPKKVSEIFGEVLRSSELDAALLEAFQSESFVPSD